MFSCNIYSITSQNLFHIQAELVMLLNYPRTESILSQIESEPCVLEIKWFRQWVGIRSSNHYDIIGGISFICFIMFLYLVKQWVAGTVALGPFKPRDLCYYFMLFKFNICTDVSPPHGPFRVPEFIRFHIFNQNVHITSYYHHWRCVTALRSVLVLCLHIFCIDVIVINVLHI